MSQKCLQRTKQKEDYSVAFDACKILVTDHDAHEALSKEASAVWLRDLGLQFRLDFGSRPLGTGGFDISTARDAETGLMFSKPVTVRMMRLADLHCSRAETNQIRQSV